MLDMNKVLLSREEREENFIGRIKYRVTSPTPVRHKNRNIIGLTPQGNGVEVMIYLLIVNDNQQTEMLWIS
ncbi:hypothetical protein CHS0354_036341 [Potamilus streckersoni]|uniref:Uncharacterized protein n=1 Tax=Potamilus streckersoni TaxID=2493646 RepID=A0AAE0VUE6_9BIVA|nr:hypothetical protein CHS0354_036341 [Potamilus streckersoni]